MTAATRVDAEPRSWLHGALVPLAYAVVITLIVVPVLWVRFPLLSDYPDHLSELYIKLHLNESAGLQRYYYLRSGLFPYQAMDLVALPLAHLVGVEAAGRAFVTIAILAPFLGTIAAARALYGRAGLLPLAASLFCYNTATAWGFLPFTFTLGLALGGLAAWIATDGWRPTARLAILAPIACLIFVSHVFVFAMYGVLIAGWEAGKLWQERHDPMPRLRQLAPQALQAVPILACLPFLGNIAIGGTETVWSVSLAHLWAIFAPLQFTLTTSELVTVVLPAIGSIGLAIYLGVEVDRRLRLMIGLLVVLCCAMPMWLFGVSFVHVRFPLLLAFLLPAALRYRGGRVGARLLMAALAALLLARTVTATAALVRMDRDVAEFREKGSVIAAGARVLPAFVRVQIDPSGSYMLNGVSVFNYVHLDSLLVIDRAILAPLTFQMFEVGIQPAYRDSAVSHGIPIPFEWLNGHSGDDSPASQHELWRDWRGKFDYVVLYDFGTDPGPIPSSLTLVAAGSFFHIYRVT